MNKIIIFLTFILLFSSVAYAENICSGVLEPNVECQMVSPSISCSNYSYELYYKNSTLIKSSNLTQWANPDIYYFNFSQGTGEYLVKLCDSTTREVKVEVSEEKMQAITMGFIFLAIYFIVMGMLVLNIYLRFGSFVLAFLQLLMMVFFQYGSYQGGNLLPVLYANFWIMMLLGFGLFMWKWFENAINLISSTKTEKNKKEGFDNSW